MKPTLGSIADLAKLAGVSKSTVSRALSGSPLVGAETRERIEALAREHGFRPNLPARYLSLGASRSVAFVTSDCSPCGAGSGSADLFNLEIMGGVAQGLRELGYDMLALYVEPGDEGWIADYLDSGLVAGFILMTYEQKSRRLELLAEREAPFIAWGIGEGRYCSVTGDNASGGRLAADRLLGRGAKRIAFLGGPEDDLESGERRRGFSELLAEAGLPLESERLVFGDYSEESGALAMERLLKADPKLDAVFAASDLMAIGAMRVLKARGRRIPEDVAVVGYDDLRLAAYVSPSLTTISQHISLTGKLLARDLVAFLGSGVVTNRVVPVELVARDSA